MDPFHFACPHCRSPLRVREKLFVGRQVDCPDCRQTLRIVEQAGELGVERVAGNSAGAATAPRAKLDKGMSSAAIDQFAESPKRPPVAAHEKSSVAAAGAADSASNSISPSAQNVARRRIWRQRPSAVVLAASAVVVCGLMAGIIFLTREGRAPFTEQNTTGPAGERAGPGEMPSDSRNDDDRLRNMPERADSRSPLTGAQDEPGKRLVQSAVDGQPPDDSIIARGGDRLPTVPGDTFDDEPLDADERPIEPEFAAERAAPPGPARKIDLTVSLKQPIARFDQPRSKPLEEVLTSVAEMAGARISFDRAELGAAAARLNEPLALKLENTTVGEILSNLLRPAGLAYRIEGDHLRVVRGD